MKGGKNNLSLKSDINVNNIFNLYPLLIQNINTFIRLDGNIKPGDVDVDYTGTINTTHNIDTTNFVNLLNKLKETASGTVDYPDDYIFLKPTQKEKLASISAVRYLDDLRNYLSKFGVLSFGRDSNQRWSIILDSEGHVTRAFGPILEQLEIIGSMKGPQIEVPATVRGEVKKGMDIVPYHISFPEAHIPCTKSEIDICANWCMDTTGHLLAYSVLNANTEYTSLNGERLFLSKLTNNTVYNNIEVSLDQYRVQPAQPTWPTHGETKLMAYYKTTVRGASNTRVPINNEMFNTLFNYQGDYIANYVPLFYRWVGIWLNIEFLSRRGNVNSARHPERPYLPLLPNWLNNDIQVWGLDEQLYVPTLIANNFVLNNLADVALIKMYSEVNPLIPYILFTEWEGNIFLLDNHLTELPFPIITVRTPKVIFHNDEIILGPESIAIYEQNGSYDIGMSLKANSLLPFILAFVKDSNLEAQWSQAVRYYIQDQYLNCSSWRRYLGNPCYCAHMFLCFELGFKLPDTFRYGRLAIELVTEREDQIELILVNIRSMLSNLIDIILDKIVFLFIHNLPIFLAEKRESYGVRESIQAIIKGMFPHGWNDLLYMLQVNAKLEEVNLSLVDNLIPLDPLENVLYEHVKQRFNDNNILYNFAAFEIFKDAPNCFLPLVLTSYEFRKMCLDVNNPTQLYRRLGFLKSVVNLLQERRDVRVIGLTWKEVIACEIILTLSSEDDVLSRDDCDYLIRDYTTDLNLLCLDDKQASVLQVFSKNYDQHNFDPELLFADTLLIRRVNTQNGLYIAVKGNFLKELDKTRAKRLANEKKTANLLTKCVEYEDGMKMGRRFFISNKRRGGGKNSAKVPIRIKTLTRYNITHLDHILESHGLKGVKEYTTFLYPNEKGIGSKKFLNFVKPNHMAREYADVRKVGDANIRSFVKDFEADIRQHAANDVHSLDNPKSNKATEIVSNSVPSKDESEVRDHKLVIGFILQNKIPIVLIDHEGHAVPEFYKSPRCSVSTVSRYFVRLLCDSANQRVVYKSIVDLLYNLKSQSISKDPSTPLIHSDLELLLDQESVDSYYAEIEEFKISYVDTVVSTILYLSRELDVTVIIFFLDKDKSVVEVKCNNKNASSVLVITFFKSIRVYISTLEHLSAWEELVSGFRETHLAILPISRNKHNDDINVVNHTVTWEQLPKSINKQLSSALYCVNLPSAVDRGQCCWMANSILQNACNSNMKVRLLEVSQMYHSLAGMLKSLEATVQLRLTLDLFYILLCNICEVGVVYSSNGVRFKVATLFAVGSCGHNNISYQSFKTILIQKNGDYYYYTKDNSGQRTLRELYKTFWLSNSDTFVKDMDSRHKLTILKWCGNIEILHDLRNKNISYKLDLVNLIQSSDSHVHPHRSLYTTLFQDFGILGNSVEVHYNSRSQCHLNLLLELMPAGGSIKLSGVDGKIGIFDNLKKPYYNISYVSKEQLDYCLQIIKNNPIHKIVRSKSFNTAFQQFNQDQKTNIIANYYSAILEAYNKCYISNKRFDSIYVTGDNSVTRKGKKTNTHINFRIDGDLKSTDTDSTGLTLREEINDINNNNTTLAKHHRGEVYNIFEVISSLRYYTPDTSVYVFNHIDLDFFGVKTKPHNYLLVIVDYTKCRVILAHSENLTLSEVKSKNIVSTVYYDFGSNLGLIKSEDSAVNVTIGAVCTISQLLGVFTYCNLYYSTYPQLWDWLFSDDDIKNDNQTHTQLSEVIETPESSEIDSNNFIKSSVTFDKVQEYQPYDIYTKEQFKCEISQTEFVDYFSCSEETVKLLDSQFPRGVDQHINRAITTVSGIIHDMRQGLVLNVSELEKQLINYLLNKHRNTDGKNSWMVCIIMYIILTKDLEWSLKIIIPCGFLSVKYSEWNDYWSTFHNCVRNIWADPQGYIPLDNHIIQVLLNANLPSADLVKVSSLCYLYTFVGRPNREVDWDDEAVKRLRNIDSFHIPIRRNIIYPYSSINDEAHRILAMSDDEYVKYILGDVTMRNYRVVYHNSITNNWEDINGQVVDKMGDEFVVEVFGNECIKRDNEVILVNDGRCFRLHNFSIPKINKYLWNPRDVNSELSFEIFKKVVNSRRKVQRINQPADKVDSNIDVNTTITRVGSVGVRPYVSAASVSATVHTINRFRDWYYNPQFKRMYNENKSLSDLYHELDTILCGLDYISFYKLVSPIINGDRYMRITNSVVNEVLGDMLDKEFSFTPIYNYTYKDHLQQAQLWVVNGSASGEDNPWDSEDLKVIKRSAEKVLGTRISTTRIQTIENSDVADMMKEFWSNHDIPHIAKSHTKGNEHGKLRSIFNSTMTNYTLGSYFAKTIGDRLKCKDMTLNKSGLDSISVLNDICNQAKDGYPCISLDYSDFNAQHPLAFQAEIIHTLLQHYLQYYLDTEMYDDVKRCSEHVANSFMNQIFVVDCNLYEEGKPRDPDDSYKYSIINIGNRKYCEYFVNSGLFSGTRLTTLLNTLFNKFYSYLVCIISRLHDIDCTPIMQQYLGDDSIMFFGTRDKRDAYLSFFYYSGLDLNASKQLRSIGKGEYLRVIHSPEGVAVGNLNRTIATHVNGNVESQTKASGATQVQALHAQYGMMERRHGNIDRVSPLLLFTCARTLWFYPSVRLLDLQIYMYTPTSLGGMGLLPVGVSGDLSGELFDNTQYLQLNDQCSEHAEKMRCEIGSCLSRISDYYTISPTIKQILTQHPSSPFYHNSPHEITVNRYLQYVRKTLLPLYKQLVRLWMSVDHSRQTNTDKGMLRNIIRNKVVKANLIGISNTYAINTLSDMLERSGTLELGKNKSSSFNLNLQHQDLSLEDDDISHIDVSELETLKKIDNNDELYYITQSLMGINTDILKDHFKSTNQLVEYLREKWNLDLDSIRYKKVLVRLLRLQLESGSISVKHQRRVDGQNWIRYVLTLVKAGCIDDCTPFIQYGPEHIINYGNWQVQGYSNYNYVHISFKDMFSMLQGTYDNYKRIKSDWLKKRHENSYIKASLLFKDSTEISNYIRDEYGVTNVYEFDSKLDWIGRELGMLEGKEFSTTKLKEIENRTRGLLGTLINIWDLLDKSEREHSLDYVSSRLSTDKQTIKRVLMRKYMRSVADFSNTDDQCNTDILSLMWLSTMLVPEFQQLYRYYLSALNNNTETDITKISTDFGSLMYLQY